MLEVSRLGALHLCFPERGDIFLIAFAHCTLVVVTETLLCPEWALSLQVNLVCAEERSLLELTQNRCNFAIETLKLLHWRTNTIHVSFSHLCCTHRWVKRRWKVLLEKVCPVEIQEDAGEKNEE